MRKKGILVVVSVLVVLALLIGGFGCKAPAPTPTPAPAPKPPVKIGYLYWMTGGGKSMGDRDVMGFKLAVKEINDAGGILGGRKVEYTEYDMGYSADAVTAAFKKALADGADTVIGFLEGGLGLLGTQLGKDYQIPVAIAGADDVQINKNGYKGYVHTYVNVKPDWSPIVDWLEEQGVKTMVELDYDTGTGRAVSQIWHESWGKPGSPVEILDSMWVSPTQMDLSVEMTRAVAQNPDFIHTQTWGPGLASVLKTGKELGYKGIIFPARSVTYPEVVAADPEIYEGLYSAESFLYDPSVPANEAFVKAHREMWGAEWTPYAVGLVDYLAVNIMMRSMDKAGTTTDLNKIYDAMMTLDWITPQGTPVKILPDGQVFYTKTNIVQIQGGEIVPILRDLPIKEEYYRWWDEEPEKIWWED